MVEVFRPLLVDEVKEYYEVLYNNLYAEYGLPREAMHDDLKVVAAGRKVAIRAKSLKKIIATGIVFLTEPEEARITDVSVEKTLRHKGIGKLLMGELERLAIKRGAVKVQLLVPTAVVPFFERLGYAKGPEAVLQFKEHKVPACTMTKSFVRTKL